MAPSEVDVVGQRLRNQQLARSAFHQPASVVRWLGAVQAQDYAGAKWAIGLRSTGSSDAAIEQAFNDGAILRTHLMRPTWHFVVPADVRWMLALTAPRVHAVNAYYYRKFGLSDALVARSRTVLERALRGGRQLTRVELSSTVAKAGMTAGGLGLAYLMMRAELDGLVCSGARRGNQFTYALLEERVPSAPTLNRDEALAELTRRYFSSHGPATVRDYAWWSGLTGRDARAGIEMMRPALVQQVLDGRTYWSVPSMAALRRPSPSVYLLPNYDEFGIAYKDRGVVPDVPRPRRLEAAGEFPHLLLVDGQLAGRWRRTLKTSTVTVEVQPFRALTTSVARALDRSVARYGAFLNLPATLSRF